MSDETDSPVAGALVALVAADGNASEEGLTDDRGFKVLYAPPGSYRIRVRRIGFYPFASAPIVVPRPNVLELHIDSKKVVLQTVVITGRPECRPARDPEEVGAVWEEIEKALRSSQLSLADLSTVGVLEVYRREYSAKGSLLTSKVNTIKLSAQRPFGAIDPADLAESGYIRGNAINGWEYFGPDEAVLLSKEFSETHCFQLVRDSVRRNQIGVAFEPKPSRKVPDISGVLWVNEQSSELHEINFRYTTAYLPGTFAGEGFARFRKMPSGAWLVGEWQLKVPRLMAYGAGIRQIAAVGHYENGGIAKTRTETQTQVATTKPLDDRSTPSTSVTTALENQPKPPIIEDRATPSSRLTQAHSRGEQTLQIIGIVVGERGEPIPNAYLAYGGNGDFALTDERGRFRFQATTQDSAVSLTIRRVGFTPIDTLVRQQTPTPSFRFSMMAITPQLDTMRILGVARGYDENLDRQGFYKRMKTAVDGTFMTYADIGKRNTMKVTELLRNVPGITVRADRTFGGKSGSVVVGRGRQCVLGVVIDGEPMSYAKSESIDDIVVPADVGGMEIYPSRTTVPAIFQAFATECGLIVVWRRANEGP